MSQYYTYDGEKRELVKLDEDVKVFDMAKSKPQRCSFVPSSKYVTLKSCTENGVCLHNAKLAMYSVEAEISTGSGEEETATTIKSLKRTFLTQFKTGIAKLVVFNPQMVYNFVLSSGVAVEEDKTMAFGSVMIEMRALLNDPTLTNLDIEFNKACQVKVEILDSETKHSENLKKVTSQPHENNRKAIKRNVTIVAKNHFLKKPIKGKYNKCAVCNKKTTEPVYKCKVCNMSVHTKSIKYLMAACRGAIGQSDGKSTFKADDSALLDSNKSSATINSPHQFSPSKKSGQECSHCGDKFKLLTSKSKCNLCGNYYHDRCIQNVPNLCGVDADFIKEIMKTARGGQSSTSKANNDPGVIGLISEDFVSKIDTGFENTEPNIQMHFNKFEPIAKIGEGSFGKVYSALHKPSNQVMALKALSMEMEIDDDFDSLVSEMIVMRIASGCATLVSLNGAFTVNGFVYFAMDVCPGGTIYDYVTRYKMKDDTLREVFAQMVLGVDFLHQNKVINRDIKSENVLLTHRGTIKICDFGLSKSLKNQTSPVCYTFCGTLPYMSPELLRLVYNDNGEENKKRSGDPEKNVYSLSVDYWALGIVFFELNSRTQLPFREDSQQMIVSAVLSKDDFKLHLEDPVANNMLQDLLRKKYRDRMTPQLDTTKEKKNTSILKEHKYFAGVNWEELESPDYKGSLPLLEHKDPAKPEYYNKRASNVSMVVSMAENTPEMNEQFSIFNYCKKEYNKPDKVDEIKEHRDE